MSIVRRLARPMMATMFVVGGADAFRHPDGRAVLAAPVATRIARAVPLPLPTDPVQLVRLDAATKVASGLLFATGRVPRLSALVMAGSLVPTTLAGHPYWTFDDAAQRATQRIQFLKNLGLLGGLLLAAVDTEGKPSLGYRARKVAQLSVRRRGPGAA